MTGTWPRVATVTVRIKSTGKVVAGAPITIKRRATTTTAYTTVGTYKTNAAGQQAYKYYPSVPTVVVMSYAGCTTCRHGLVAGREEPAGEQVRLARGDPRRHHRRRGQGHPGRGRHGQTVLLQRRYAGSSTWTTVATLRTSATGYATSQQQPKRNTY